MKEELTFAEQERKKERERAAKYVRVPKRGLYIWKYQGKQSGGRGFASNIAIFMILIVAALTALCIGMVFLTEKLGRTDAVLWLNTVFIFVCTAVIVLLAWNIGQRANSKQLAFARSEDGKLYVFDYRAPAFEKYGRTDGVNFFLNSMKTAKKLRRIDDAQIIEHVMETGRIYPYGKQITEVKSIAKAAGGYRIYCTLLRENGAEWHTSLVLSSAYSSFDALLQNLERLR